MSGTAFAAEARPLGPVAATAPSVARRLGSFIYEGVLLFGIVMLVGLTYGLVANQRHALVGTPGLRVTLFVALGLYFVYFWSRRGQTLAMKTWRLKLLGPGGTPPGPWRAVVRYLLAWLWFMPALLAVSLAGLKGGLATSAVVLAGTLAYAALSWLRADRQFLHDVVCGTRLVDTIRDPAKVAR